MYDLLDEFLPYPFVAATLASGAVSGIYTTQLIPQILAAKAQPWEWLPELQQAILEPFGRVQILLNAPRNLKVLQR